MKLARVLIMIMLDLLLICSSGVELMNNLKMVKHKDWEEIDFATSKHRDDTKVEHVIAWPPS